MPTSAARVRVFIASSLDGFIAGPDGDLSWLPSPSEGVDYGYHAFMAEVGALLMGRATYAVVEGFLASGEAEAWPYGDRPVLVATHRPLDPVHPSVRAVSGSIDALIDAALEAAKGRDVYIDGGALIRQALDAGRVDEIVVSLVPVLLGAGAPLFAGLDRRCPLELRGSQVYADGVVQLRYGTRGVLPSHATGL